MKIILTLFSICMASMPALSTADEELSSPKPNVLLIAVDDLNDWVGCLGGHPDARSQHIDRLAKRGVLFTNTHCQAPICNPSRTSILYGLRPSNSGIYDNQTKPWEVAALKKRVTLPRHFAANGYRTLTTGKIYHDSGMPKGDFDVVGPVPGQRNPLDAGPHAKNTIVVLYSDHGFFLGEKQHWAKQSLWERATRVPLIISVPGMASGQSCSRSVELLGIYPTLIDLCGLTPRNDIDGTSLAPLMQDPKAEWTRPALTTHGRNNHSIRTERYRYTVYHDGSEEFYDHTSDPNEWTNAAALPEHAAVKKELTRWLPKTNVPPAIEIKGKDK